MKRFILIGAVLAISASFSAPQYYTFNGKINFVPSDIGGYAATHGIRAGVAVTYLFVVDTARTAYTLHNGTPNNMPDTLNEGTGYRADYFFDSLITPSLFSPAVTDSSSGSYLGYRTTTKSGANFRYALAFQTTIGNPDHRTQIVLFVPDTGSSNFLPKVGDVVSATEAYKNGSTASSSASMSLTLTAISNTKPANLLRPGKPMASAWMEAELRNGTLILQNHSGKKAVAKVLDASGKTSLAYSVGEWAAIPLATLPSGRLFLEVTSQGGRQPARQTFFYQGSP